jgi:ferritin-like metal-binding protein YciE
VDAFVVGLQRMLWIEEWLAHELLPELLPPLGLERHLVETKQHALTVRTILTLLGERHDPQPSEALPLLATEIVETTDLLAQIEHLEIAAYTALRSRAYARGEDAVGLRLTEILDQEQYALELVENVRAKLLAERVTNA